MKKLIALLSILGILTFGFVNVSTVQAQDEVNAEEVVDADAEEAIDAEDTVAPIEEEVSSTAAIEEGAEEQKAGYHQILKEKFIEGGAGFMSTVLLCLILGLAIAIERIIYLNMASTNTKKLLTKLENALDEGGIEAGKDICRNTRGPVASIFYQGLERYDEGLDMVEKSVVSYGGVQMGRLEKNMTWISLFIAIAPMLGFMGTVIGMIGAFDDIATAGDISPTIVADGIKMALLTTVFGLIVGVTLQIFNNYLLSKIDGIVNDMEDASITFIDILSSHKNK